MTILKNGNEAVFDHRKSALVAASLLLVALATARADEFSELVDHHSGAARDVVAYQHVTLIDVVSGVAKPEMTIVVNGDRIESVLAASDPVVPAVDRTVDASDWYALPGLVDTHVHLATLPDRNAAEAILNRHVFGGVTTVRDMAGDVRELAGLSRAALLNQINAPDIHYSALLAGPSFFSDQRTVFSALGRTPGDLPWMRAVSDDTDIRLAVAEAKGSGASGIKLYANLDSDLVSRVVSEAHRQNFRVWGHAKIYPTTPLQGVNSGMHAISHACMLVDHALLPERTEYQRPGSFETSQDYRSVTREHPRLQEVFGAMARRGTFFDATLIVYESNDRQAGAELDPAARCTFEQAAMVAGAASRAGVRLTTGTDVVAEAEEALPSLLHEVELMVSGAGLSNAEALRAATINGIALLGLEDDLGTIEAGKQANIVFTADNPLDDVSNLRSVQLTLKRGRPFPRSNYEHSEETHE